MIVAGHYRKLRGHTWDLLLTDPPFSARTHAGQSEVRRALSYEHWAPADMRRFLRFALPRTRGWSVVLTDHVLAPVVMAACEEAGRYAFAPIPCLTHAVRQSGDGPASAACYTVASRPRSAVFARWGALPGFYGPFQAARDWLRLGAKPAQLAAALVRDYSEPGDLVCDPCAGGAALLLAALEAGRRAIGSEVDLDAARVANARLADAPLLLPGVSAALRRQSAFFGADP